MKPSLILTLALLLATVFAPAAAVAECEPSEAVSAALDEAKEIAKSCGRSTECARRQLAGVEQALELHPASVRLHRMYQDLAGRLPSDGEMSGTELVEARYRHLAEEHPGDPAYLYLLARALVNTDGDEAKEVFEQALTVAPEYPWALLGALYLHMSDDDEEKDDARARATVDRLAAACPSMIEFTPSYVQGIGDAEYWRPRVTRWSQDDASRTIGHYRGLWALEFRTPPSEHAAVRERVRQDLGRLEALARRDDPAWWSILKQGYELLGDEEKIAEIDASLAKLQPCESMTVRAAFERWDGEHPRPGRQDDEYEEWRGLRHVLARQWHERCPDSMTASVEVFYTLPEDADDETFDAAADSYLTNWEAERGMSWMRPSPYFQVAQSYVARERYDRIPELVKKARKDAELYLERIPEARRERFVKDDARQLFDETALVAEAHIAQGQLDPARGLLMELEEALVEPAEDASSMEKLFYKFQAANYWSLQARLAEADGRKLDAVVYYRNAYDVGESEEHLEQAAKLWREVGGSDLAFDALGQASASGDPSERSRWEKKSEALAEFELPDLKGKTWQLADFGGKRVFANLWATWCGPCRLELPLVQKLHERLKDDPDTLVVTLNVDQNAGLVQPYLDKNEFTFPVLFAEDFVRDMVGALSIPRNWLIDREGTLRKEQTGFNPSAEAEEWITEMIEALGEVEEEAGTM